MFRLPLGLLILIVGCVNAQEEFFDLFISFDDANKSKNIPIDWNVEHPFNIILIDVSNVYVEKINSGAFKNFTSLEDLYLSGKMTTIEDGAFTGLMNLSRITLNGVGIQEIGPKVFYNLNSLKLLDMAKNEIKEVKLTNLTLLTELNLSHNHITKLSNNTFINLENVKSIDLSVNKIRAIKFRAFHGCPNLTTLNLNKNQIANIEPRSAFGKSSKLEVLLLSHNNFTTVTRDQFIWLVNLKRLDLSNNLINKIYSFAILEALTSLDLSHNKITSPAVVSLWLPKLTEVRLDHNSITILPEYFLDHAPKLEYLGVGFNLLKNLNLSNKLEKLRRVLLQHNQLQSIELAAITQKNIEVLHLSDNNLTHLDESFQHLINLQELLLKKNKIKSFPLCIPDSLTNLDLSHNELHGIALDKFCGSVSQGMLRIVDLSSNQFRYYNLTHSNKSLQKTQPDLNDIDLSRNYLNADSVKQIQNFDLRHVEFLNIGQQQTVVVNISRDETMNGKGNPTGNETTTENGTVLPPVKRSDPNEKDNTTWIIVTSVALAAVGVFAVIAAILFVCKQRRRTNPNRNINDAVMLDELYDDIRSAPYYHYLRFPVYDTVANPPIYHYPRFRPRYDEVRPQPVYLAVLPDIPGPQCLEQKDNEPEENHYEEID